MAGGIHPRERLEQGEIGAGLIAITGIDGALRIPERDHLGSIVEEVESVILAGTRAFEQGPPLRFRGIDEILRRARSIKEHPEIDPTRFQHDPWIAEQQGESKEEERSQRTPEFEVAESPSEQSPDRQQKEKLGRGEGHAKSLDAV